MMIDSAPHAPSQPVAPEQLELFPVVRDGEITLFRSEGVLVTSERLVAGRRTWLLGEVEAVDAHHRPPRVLPLIFTLVVGVVLGLPGFLSAMAAPGAAGKGLYELGLVLAGAVVFGSIAGILLIGDTWWLVLRTRQQEEQRVFRTRDQRLASQLVDVVSEAVSSHPARKTNGLQGS